LKVSQRTIKKFGDLDWKRWLFNLSKEEILGLDIGSSAVKLVQMHRTNGSYTVTAAAMVNIVDGTADKAEHKQINTIRAIRESVLGSGTTTRLAVCGVSGPEAAVRYFKFPQMPPEEIEEAVVLEAAQICPFSVDDGAVDYRLTGRGKGGVSGVLVAATNKLMERKVRLAEGASLGCALMDVDGLALLNCLSECEGGGDSKAKAVLNVGSAYTTLAVMNEEGVPFVRDIAYAGSDIIRQMATEHNVAAEIIVNVLTGSEKTRQLRLELGDSLSRACRKLVADVTDTLRYYATHEKSAAVKEIFVCGGFALVEGFVELLAGQLSEKVTLWNPFEKMRCEAGRECVELLQKSGPAMAVAAGLAMRSV
jgi:type IV pilus assembly protein PilM